MNPKPTTAESSAPQSSNKNVEKKPASAGDANLSAAEVSTLKEIIQNRAQAPARSFIQELLRSNRNESALRVAFFLGQNLSHQNIFSFMRLLMKPGMDSTSKKELIPQETSLVDLQTVQYHLPGALSAETMLLFTLISVQSEQLIGVLREPNESQYLNLEKSFRDELKDLGLKSIDFKFSLRLGQNQGTQFQTPTKRESSVAPITNPLKPPEIVPDLQPANIADVAQKASKDLPEGVSLSWKVKNIEEAIIEDNQTLRRSIENDHILANANRSEVQLEKEIFGAHRWEKFRTFVNDFYLGLFSREILAADDRIDRDLDPRRVHTIAVDSTQGAEVSTIGTLRLVDGSMKLPSNILTDTMSGEMPPLPFQWLLSARGRHSTFSDLLNKIRFTRPQQRVFEIGRYTMAPPASRNTLGDRKAQGELTNKTRNALFTVLRDYYCALYPDAIFVVHATTPSQRRYYETRFKLKLEETLTFQDSDGRSHEEYIFSTTGLALRKALDEFLDPTSDSPPLIRSR